MQGKCTDGFLPLHPHSIVCTKRQQFYEPEQCVYWGTYWVRRRQYSQLHVPIAVSKTQALICAWELGCLAVLMHCWPSSQMALLVPAASAGNRDLLGA